ncbi:MAG: toprim domain-containing protein [Burkholderiaceae bacterium]
MRYGKKTVKLVDCRVHGPDSGAELFLVEGDSAASSVASQRDKNFQAVLPMQGKPMNAIKASESRIMSNALFVSLFDALGKEAVADKANSLFSLRFEKVVLLFDPDADGIHSGALMLMFLSRFYPALLNAGRVLTVRAPLFRVTSASLGQSFYAASEAHLAHIRKQLADRAVTDTQTIRYRGLGSLEQDLLAERCIDPQTRVADVMNMRDAAMAVEVFGG